MIHYQPSRKPTTSIGQAAPRLVRWLPLATILLGLAMYAASPALADPPPAAGDNLSDVKQDHPGFYVRASCDHATGVYEEGDPLVLTVKCESDAYLYVIYEQSDGKRYQIFPNSGQPDNRVRGGEEIRVPGKDDLFRWNVSPPFGKEKVLVVASKKPVDALSLPELQKSVFNPVSSRAFKGAALELNQHPDKDWTEHYIEITTTPRSAKPRPELAGRRFGLFIGVGGYPWIGPPLTFPVSDATLTGRTFQEFAGIPANRSFLLVDDMATKANIAAMILGKLPAVTKPGDTVVIYFSGHGGPIPDEPPGQPGHDEEDGQDETLAPWDILGVRHLNQITKELKAVGGDPKKMRHPEVVPTYDRVLDNCGSALKALGAQIEPLEQQLEAMKDRPDSDPQKADLINRVNALAERQQEIIVRETSISDDEFGHWLQRLDGRTVIVITDACHSGGFDVNAKRNPSKDVRVVRAGERSLRFDFLERESSRLKDLGQGDIALLAAAEFDLPSLESTNTWGGVFTKALNGALRDLPGPVTLDNLYAEVKVRMAKWFDENRNALIASARQEGKEFKEHHPQMATYGKMPIVKP